MRQVLAMPHYTKTRVTESPFGLQPPSSLSPVTLLSPSPYDTSQQGYKDWTFMSTHFWDEDPNGTWTLLLENKGDAYNTGGPQGMNPIHQCHPVPHCSPPLVSTWLASSSPCSLLDTGSGQSPLCRATYPHSLLVSLLSAGPGGEHCFPQIFQPHAHRFAHPKSWRVGTRSPCPASHPLLLPQAC